MGSAILYGAGVIFVLAIISSFIFSILLRFTSVTETSLTYIIMAASFISLFIGGFISGGRGKKQGWMLGGGTGLLYLIIIMLFKYLGHDSLFSLKEWIYQGCFILTAMMGGVLGVNLSSNSK
ncbi:TIGR04086 family membrane protein [Actinomycetes bacterium NPDC127524]|uniref:TIGR04086 family membrane protein n=1 Tax=Bacillus sp. OV322 TaxID=1882764 RepID=UPI0008F218D0|nr:TIGR04086 family membrane protein [Bacillus sp. OV322]SFC53610.1 putative membrane protein, TIGR04086 family [Bacillus sp. OV322]